MHLDSIERRIRFAPPQPTGRMILLKDRDFAIFDAINRHGPLPSHYLYELTRHLPNTKNFKTFQNRLTKLYNGYCANWPTHPNHECEPVTYLARPERQYGSFFASYQPMVYDLAPRAQAELAMRGEKVATRTDPFLHRLMGSCFSASVQLAAQEAGHRFISKEGIFNHPKCPEATKQSNTPLALPLAKGALIPDNLMAIDYGDGYRRLVVEIDRSTESIDSNVAKTTYGRKLESYIKIIRSGTFRDVWGISKLLVTTVTTNPLHMQHMIDYFHTLGAEDLAPLFIFKWIPHFSANWRVPPIYTDILKGWTVADGTTLDL